MMGYRQGGKAQDFDSCITLVRVQLSQPKKPTCFNKSVFQLNPPIRVGEILLRNVKYAYGVRDEYNITERAGFNITVEDGISLKTLCFGFVTDSKR